MSNRKLTYSSKIIRRNFVPNAKQYLFLLDHHRHVAFGGARGGGKSWVVDFKAVLLARKYGRPNEWSQGIRICIIRRTLQDLMKNHLTQLKLLIGKAATYNSNDKCFYFKNGATIQLAYCNHDKDSDHFMGVEYDVIFIEEATQMEPDWLKKIVTSCRGVNEFPHRCYYTCNPGGPGHAYIKRLFVDRKYLEDEDPEDYSFIQSLVTDNTILQQYSPEYVKFLDGLPPKLRSAWRDGNWEIYEGMYFESFRNNPAGYKDKRWTHVIDPIPIKSYWPIYRSFDWGYNKPFSCGWYTVDDDGVIYRIAELYGVQKSGGESIPDMGVKWVPEKVFSEIQKMEHEHPLLKGRQITGVADPAIWDAQFGKSIAETAEKYQIYFEPGDHERIPGWMQCQYRLMFDDEGYANFYVFNTCPEFIRTIVTLQYDEHRPEDLDTKGEDHIADEWRYLCMKFLLTPEPEKVRVLPMFGADPLNQLKGAMAW